MIVTSQGLRGLGVWSQSADENGTPYWYETNAAGEFTGNSTLIDPTQNQWVSASDEQGSYYRNASTGVQSWEGPGAEQRVLQELPVFTGRQRAVDEGNNIITAQGLNTATGQWEYLYTPIGYSGPGSPAYLQSVVGNNTGFKLAYAHKDRGFDPGDVILPVLMALVTYGAATGFAFAAGGQAIGVGVTPSISAGAEAALGTFGGDGWAVPTFAPESFSPSLSLAEEISGSLTEVGFAPNAYTPSLSLPEIPRGSLTDEISASINESGFSNSGWKLPSLPSASSVNSAAGAIKSLIGGTAALIGAGGGSATSKPGQQLMPSGSSLTTPSIYANDAGIEAYWPILAAVGAAILLVR